MVNPIKFEKMKDKEGKYFLKPNFSKDKDGHIFADIPEFKASGDLQ